MNGRILVSKPLYVALAQRKEDRKAQLASQYMQRMAGMRMQQMGQMFQPGGPGYFMPAPIQPQRFYTPAQMAQFRATPRWSAQPQVQENHNQLFWNFVTVYCVIIYRIQLFESVGSPNSPAQPTRCRISRVGSVSRRSAPARSATRRPLDAIGSSHYGPTAHGAPGNAWSFARNALWRTRHASTTPRIQVHSNYAQPAQPSKLFIALN